MAGAKCFQKLQNYVSGGKFYSKNRAISVCWYPLSLAQSFGQIVVTVEVPFETFHSQM